MDNSAIYSEDHSHVNVKFLGVVFLYMFLGLAITALTAFGFAAFLASAYRDPTGEAYLNQTGQEILIFSVIGAAIVSLVDGFVLPFVSRRTGRAPWFGYILYALAMGVMPFISWATHVLQWPVQRDASLRRQAKLGKPVSVQIEVCNSTSWNAETRRLSSARCSAARRSPSMRSLI